MAEYKLNMGKRSAKMQPEALDRRGQQAQASAKEPGGKETTTSARKVFSWLWYPISAIWFMVVSIDHYRLTKLFKHDVADASFKLVECPLVREQELLQSSAVFLFSAGLVTNFLSGSPNNNDKVPLEKRWQFQTLWGITMLLTLSAVMCSYAARTGMFRFWSLTRDYIKQMTVQTEGSWSKPQNEQPLLLLTAQLQVCEKKEKAAAELRTAIDTAPDTSAEKLHKEDTIQALNRHRGSIPQQHDGKAEDLMADSFKGQVLQVMYWMSMGSAVRFTTNILGLFLSLSRCCFGVSLFLWLATIQDAVVALGGAWKANKSQEPSHSGGMFIFVIVSTIEIVLLATIGILMVNGWQISNQYHKPQVVDTNTSTGRKLGRWLTPFANLTASEPAKVYMASHLVKAAERASSRSLSYVARNDGSVTSCAGDVAIEVPSEVGQAIGQGLNRYGSTGSVGSISRLSPFLVQTPGSPARSPVSRTPAKQPPESRLPPVASVDDRQSPDQSDASADLEKCTHAMQS